MLDPTMTEDELAAQADRNGHHYFRTCRQTPIRIDETRTLRDAITNAFNARQHLAAAREHEHMVSGAEAYATAQAMTVQREQEWDDCKAQAQAAFFRETGHWPYQLHALNL